MPGALGLETLKTRFGNELERIRRKGQERMSRREMANPEYTKAVEVLKAQESIGLAPG